MPGACDDCLRRTDLIAALAGYLDVEWRRRGAPARVLALADEALLKLAAGADISRRYGRFEPASSGDIPQRYGRFDPASARARIAAAGLTAICRCDAGYPARLRELPDPPAVLHVLGDPRALAPPDAVAIVGARRASAYGLDVARTLGRGLAAAGVPVVSGLAIGIDSAAHAGAVEAPRSAALAPARPLAVLAASAEVPYPAGGRRLHEEVARRGAVVAELPPGSTARRWCFVARNRIIAALSAVTVIVQATERSGSLTTADFAAELGRTVAAVPGPVTSRLAAGTNALLYAGAPLVRGVTDVLDLLADATGRSYAARGERPSPAEDLPPPLRQLLDAVEAGRGTLGQLAATADEARTILAALGELEFRGLIRRGPRGRFERLPS